VIRPVFEAPPIRELPISGLGGHPNADEADGTPRERPGCPQFLLKETWGCLKQSFALGLFARDLSGAANRLGPFAGTSFAGFLEMLPKLHFAEDAFTLHLLFQGSERLINIVVANADLHVAVTTFQSGVAFVDGVVHITGVPSFVYLLDRQ